MAAIWSPEHKVVLERRLWIAVLRAQRDLGVDVPDGVDRGLREGRRRRRPRLDRRPRAGHPPRREGADRGVLRARRARAHPQGDDLAATSPRTSSSSRSARRSSSCATATVAALARLAELAAEHDDLVMAGRIPQRRRPGDHARQALRHRRPTSCWSALERRRRAARPLPAARHQGPGGHRAGPARPARRRRGRRLAELEQRVAAPPRLRRGCSTSVGQVYPRSLDFDVVVGAACSSSPAPSSLATTIRLMAGPRAGHRGLRSRARSARRAMPHKMNTRSCERVNGLAVVLRGHLVDGRRAGRRPVERGRRLLLGRPPGGAARRVLRHRRAVRDVPDRARRVRRLPGGDRSASSTATCRSWPPPRC